MSAAFSDDEKMIAVYQCVFIKEKCSEGEVLVWSLVTGRIVRELAANTEFITTPIFGGDGKFVAIGMEYCGLTVWNLPDGELINNNIDALKGHLCGNTFFSRNGSPTYNFGDSFVSSAPKNYLHVIDVRTGKSVDFLPKRPLFKMNLQTKAFYPEDLGDSALSPDKKTLALSACRLFINDRCQEAPISLIDTNTAQIIKGLWVPGRFDRYSLHFIYHPSGKSLITSGYGRPYLIDVDTGKSAMRFERVLYYVTPLSVSEDGRILVASTSEGFLTLWNLKTGKLLVELYVLPDGDWIAKTPDNHFDCSGCAVRDANRGMKYIRWREKGKSYPAEKFFKRYYRPGLLAAVTK